MTVPWSAPRFECIFSPGGTTDGVKCAGEVHSYWIDDGEGDVTESLRCDAHAPDDSEDASSRGFPPRQP